MQCKGAHGIVRVGIYPGIGFAGIVDGQQLDHVLTGFHGPIYQLFNIVELSHAKAVFRTEGEHGNGNAGTAPGLRREAGLDVCQHYLRILGGHFCKEMVGALFPGTDLFGFGIYDDKLVLDGLTDIHGGEPPGSQFVGHHMNLVPVAQFVSAAHHGQGLVGAHLGGGHLDAHVAAGSFLGLGMAEGNAGRTAENNVAEGR